MEIMFCVIYSQWVQLFMCLKLRIKERKSLPETRPEKGKENKKVKKLNMKIKRKEIQIILLIKNSELP